MAEHSFPIPAALDAALSHHRTTRDYLEASLELHTTLAEAEAGTCERFASLQRDERTAASPGVHPEQRDQAFVDRLLEVRAPLADAYRKTLGSAASPLDYSDLRPGVRGLALRGYVSHVCNTRPHTRARDQARVNLGR